MPGLTIATGSGVSRPSAPAPQPSATARPDAAVSSSQAASAAAAAAPPSPPRPPVSPITPTPTPAHLAPTRTGSGTYYAPDFASGRPYLAHAAGAGADANLGATAAPRPEPLDFNANPDVLALQSTISILQLQRQKALADMGRLRQARDAALADPEAFVADLTADRIGTLPDVPYATAAAGESDDDDDDSDDDDRRGDGNGDGNGDVDMGQAGAAGDRGATGGKPKARKPPRKAWHNLPQPQAVVRMPPVNFDKYGVVGESLDKLHAEQLRRPPQGAPATIATDGTYTFRAGAPVGQEYMGVAAPLNPLRDKIDKKNKGSKR